MKTPVGICFALAVSAVSAHGGLIVDGVRVTGCPRDGLSPAAYAAVTNYAGQNFYRIQSLPAGGVSISPGYVTLQPNYNDSLTLSFGGVSLYRGYGFPQSLDFLWPQEAGRLVTGQSYPFPVFRLDLGEHWTDFEIKATTNAYAVEGAAGSNLVYYYRSWTADQYWSNPDTNAWAYFTDDYAADPRVWIRKGLTNSIADQLANTGSVVCAVYFFPSRNCGCGWMRRDNTNLVWSWLRVSDGEYEKRLDGAKTRWRAIRPESWESGRTTP